MKKILSALLIAIYSCMYSCSSDDMVDTPDPTPPITSEEVQDSLFYSTDVTDFEVVAAIKDDIVAFMQKDTLFDFRCLFDSCQNSRLIAYCDSFGNVERISVNNRVFDFLYHKDRSKLDILYQKDGKLDFIRDVENPFMKVLTRAESGDVPFSAIQSLSHASYGIYTIINSYPFEFVEDEPLRYTYMKRFSTPPCSSKLALDIIATIYKNEYGPLIGNYYAEIASIMKDYSTWVRGELYGNALPLARRYAVRDSGRVNLYAMVNDVEADKQDFKVGIIIQDSENTLFSGYYNCGNAIHNYDINKVYYKCTFPLKDKLTGKILLPTGKRYKFKSYLAPLSSSKYLEGVKCLIDYYKYGSTHTFDLLEATAKVVSHGDTHATIELNTKISDHQRIKMGLYYGTNPKLPKNDRSHVECNIAFNDYVFSDQITKTIELENLIADTVYYYMPYIIYDGNILNNYIESGDITEEDHTFYGEIQSFETQKIKVFTVGDVYEKPVLHLMGSYDPEQYKPEQFGICYSTENAVPTLSDNILQAQKQEEGEFTVSISNAQKNKIYYYRAYMVLDSNIYYGEVMTVSTEEPDEALILGEWNCIYQHLTPYVPEDDERFYEIPDFEIITYMSFKSDHSFTASIGSEGHWSMPSANRIITYIDGLGEGDDDEGWFVYTIVSITDTEMHLQIYYPGLYKYEAIYKKQIK